jgi:hypothetical protein
VDVLRGRSVGAARTGRAGHGRIFGDSASGEIVFAITWRRFGGLYRSQAAPK